MENEEVKTYKVYKYTNKVNGKVYIGQTRYSLKRRAGTNGRCYKRCTCFGRAIEKYGWENFEAEILEDNLTLSEANEKETFYIKHFDSMNKEKGYNLYEGGDNKHLPQEYIDKLIQINKGRKRSEEQKALMADILRRYTEEHGPAFKGHHHTEEAKKKMSEQRKGRIPPNKGKKMKDINPDYVHHFLGKHHSEESRRKMSESHTLEKHNFWNQPKKESTKKILAEKNSIPVRCVETGIEYPSAKAASEATGICRTDISSNCKGTRRVAGKLHWEYVDKGRNSRDHVNNPPRKVRCVETGELFKTMKSAAESVGLTSHLHIKLCCEGKIETCSGYHWEYYEGPINKIKIQCIETGELFDTAREAMDAKGIKFNTIHACCKGRRYKTCGGFHWRYYNPEEDN